MDGTWKISYASSKQYPIFTDEKEITKFRDVSKTLYPNKCGTFRYEKDFICEEELDDALLYIEDAYETVQVFLDQKDLGYRITPPYQFPIEALSEGIHHLAIEVTNTLDKEIHDMFSLTETQEPSGIIGTVEIRK